MGETNGRRETRICPRCGKKYTGYPALSRKDNETLICPDCGVRESLESIGVSAEEQEKILSIIHNTYKGIEDGDEG